jgi:DNA-binding transcriptional LysR family regulator
LQDSAQIFNYRQLVPLGDKSLPDSMDCRFIMDRLVAMEIYRAVVNSGSFARAAALLHISPASTSRNISDLERHLGVSLLRRSTRSITPTEIGEQYFAHCCDILDRIGDAESIAGDTKAKLTGRLRISMPNTFGLRYVAPLIPGFLQLYPQIETDIWFSDRKVDFIEDGFDIAIRVTRELKTTLIAKKLASIQVVPTAAPCYLERHGTPLMLDDLREHDCLTYSYATYGDTWRFLKNDTEHLVPIKSSFRSNNGDMIRLACLGGRGIAVQPTFIAGDDLRSGALVRLLPDFHMSPSAAYAVYPVDRRGCARIHAFVEYLTKAFDEVASAWDRDLPVDGGSPRIIA